MNTYVAREFDVDFIYLDFIFTAIWIVLLWRQKHMLALKFGLAGALITFLADDVWMYHIQETRIIDAPFSPDLYLACGSFTAGMVMFSYVIVMFSATKTSTKVLWTAFLYLGWGAIAFLSQWIPLDDRLITMVRDMSDIPAFQIGMVVGGYILLVILKYRWKYMKPLTWPRIAYLFLVGFLIIFAMEFTLWISGIRPAEGAVDVLIFNSFIQFNVGIPVLYIVWTFITRVRTIEQLGQITSDTPAAPDNEKEITLC
ncbi:MAG TPA: hypothetical protein G4O13_06925 [Dehalococcoidia bacterium]|nr:hypothetical protein [Dehalococcoidia bacterium]